MSKIEDVIKYLEETAPETGLDVTNVEYDEENSAKVVLDFSRHRDTDMLRRAYSVLDKISYICDALYNAGHNIHLTINDINLLEREATIYIISP